MRCFIFAVAASLFTSALAVPPSPACNGLTKRFTPRGGACMTDDSAQQVATNFATLITSYSDALADASLTVDFVDYSDSVNELINNGCSTPNTLGEATFTSRDEFETAQGAQPSVPFQQLNLWHTCDTVTIRWVSAQTPEQVTGITVLETVPNAPGAAQPWLINAVYSEFNSGAWLVNLGVFVPTCS